MSRSALSAPDIAVVGAGLVGASLAFGFARAGASVALIDAGEDSSITYSTTETGRCKSMTSSINCTRPNRPPLMVDR